MNTNWEGQVILQEAKLNVKKRESGFVLSHLECDKYSLVGGGGGQATGSKNLNDQSDAQHTRTNCFEIAPSKKAQFLL